MDCKITSIDSSQRRGFTLIEMLMAVGIGSILFTSVALMLFHTSRSYAAMFNYVDLDQHSRNALDRMSQEIRQADRLISGTASQLNFSFNGSTLSYTYDPAAKTLTRTYQNQSQVLLTQCDTLSFSIFQRNPVGGSYDVYPTAQASTTKLVQLNWTCSRNILGKTWNTESVQSAKIVLRKE